MKDLEKIRKALSEEDLDMIGISVAVDEELEVEVEDHIGNHFYLPLCGGDVELIMISYREAITTGLKTKLEYHQGSVKALKKQIKCYE